MKSTRHTHSLAAYAERSQATQGKRSVLTDRPMPRATDSDDAPVWEYATRYANRESLLGHGWPELGSARDRVAHVREGGRA